MWGAGELEWACFREVYEKSLFSKQKKVLQMLGTAPSEHPRAEVGTNSRPPGPTALGAPCTLPLSHSPHPHPHPRRRRRPGPGSRTPRHRRRCRCPAPHQTRPAATQPCRLRLLPHPSPALRSPGAWVGQVAINRERAAQPEEAGHIPLSSRARPILTDCWAHWTPLPPGPLAMDSGGQPESPGREEDEGRRVEATGPLPSVSPTNALRGPTRHHAPGRMFPPALLPSLQHQSWSPGTQDTGQALLQSSVYARVFPTSDLSVCKLPEGGTPSSDSMSVYYSWEDTELPYSVDPTPDPRSWGSGSTSGKHV